MLALLAPHAVDGALALLEERGVEAWVCGEVRTREPGERGDAEAKGGGGGAVSLVGTYASG
jgi:phosphoribosylformylglycinamidine cyclo-ligase